MNPLIELKNVNKYYNVGQEKLHVLKNICLTVDAGEFVTILGASGSGKSTLMNLIGFMDNVQDGEYYFDGALVSNASDNALTTLRNEKIGFIFQKYHLIPQYTVLQNIIMPLLIRGFSRAKAVDRAEKSIQLVGLSDRINHKPNELSGGQQQRVAIARALITQPSLLLADEPTGALDSSTGKEILQLFKNLNQSGHTIIMITHDENIAQTSRRIVKLKDGIIEL